MTPSQKRTAEHRAILGRQIKNVPLVDPGIPMASRALLVVFNYPDGLGVHVEVGKPTANRTSFTQLIVLDHFAERLLNSDSGAEATLVLEPGREDQRTVGLGVVRLDSFATKGPARQGWTVFHKAVLLSPTAPVVVVPGQVEVVA